MKKRKNHYLQTSKTRNSFEESIKKQLEDSGVRYDYEPKEHKVKYVTKTRTYLPDFRIQLKNKALILETKGYFLGSDRAKHLYIQKQHPDIEVRFVFMDSSKPINKGSKTTYADWCIKHGFKYCDKKIPKEWLKEIWQEEE